MASKMTGRIVEIVVETASEKQPFFLAAAETVVAGTRRVHWPRLISVLFGSVEFLSDPTTQRPKVDSTTRRTQLSYL